jgi:hypothetical protein
MTTPESTYNYENEPTTREPTSRDRDYETNDAKTRPLNVVDSQTDEPSYLRQDAQADVNNRWQEVQTEFVDDPRKSVAHAHQLVSDAVQRIVDTFTEERNQLERQWSEGEDVSTEDLRVCLQRYRAFFTRLVPLETTRS